MDEQVHVLEACELLNDRERQIQPERIQEYKVKTVGAQPVGDCTRIVYCRTVVNGCLATESSDAMVQRLAEIFPAVAQVHVGEWHTIARLAHSNQRAAVEEIVGSLEE